MNIERIFVDDDGVQGLHAMVFDGEDLDEYNRLFDLWYEPGYLLKYCKTYENEIFKYFGLSRLEDFIELVYDEIESFEDVFEDFNQNYLGRNNARLCNIFIPLSKTELLSNELQLSKARVDRSGYFPVPVLRMYAVMISKNAFVVTGGCIKLAQKMQDITPCRIELEKLNEARKYLNRIDCTTEDDLIFYYESR